MPNNGLNGSGQGGDRMIPPHLDAAGLDLEELDAFLISDRAPENCMQLSDLDGFLTAVAIGPELIMPSEWLPVIWGEGEPEFESSEEAQGVIGAIMGRYNEILHLIRHQPDDYEPVFWETPDGDVVAGDWAEGFMAGVALRWNAWRSLLESEEDGGLLAPIVAFLHDEDGSPLIQDETDQLVEVQKAAIDLVAPSVQAISNYWKAHGRTSRRASKTGRNDPCPCGSGRKYKRCCGAN
jgi:uncharacterized protein